MNTNRKYSEIQNEMSNCTIQLCEELSHRIESEKNEVNSFQMLENTIQDSEYNPIGYPILR